MDELLRHRWATVYCGNSKNHAATIWHYLVKYASYIYRAASFHVDSISGQDLYFAVAHASHTAQGMDHWAYADYQLLDVSAFDVLASLLDLVET
eukprot:10283093-Karenia_brevis.AAC.1